MSPEVLDLLAKNGYSRYVVGNQSAWISPEGDCFPVSSMGHNRFALCYLATDSYFADLLPLLEDENVASLILEELGWYHLGFGMSWCVPGKFNGDHRISTKQAELLRYIVSISSDATFIDSVNKTLQEYEVYECCE